MGLFAVVARKRGDRRKITLRVIEALRDAAEPWRTRVGDAILQLLTVAERRGIEEAMREGYRTGWLNDAYLKGKAEGRAEGKAEGKEEGRAEGARASLRRVLASRGFAISAEFSVRIDRENDVARLEQWHGAALSAATLAEIFADA